MNTIGLLGGMSWVSTMNYYKAINEGINAIYGDIHSGKFAMYSVDFAEIAALQREGNWKVMAEILSNHARGIEAAGADCLLICTNTMHKIAPEIQASISIPLLHIGDATAEVLVADGIGTVGLLGTAFTMEQDFYKGKLTDGYGLSVLIPEAKDREIVHKVIFEELSVGRIDVNSKREYLRIIDGLAAKGAEAIILGCTEIGLLVAQADTQIRLYDTTVIHVEKAIQFATA